MKFANYLLIAAMSTTSIDAFSCMNNIIEIPEPGYHTELHSEFGEKDWPNEISMNTISLFSLLIPIQATIVAKMDEPSSGSTLVISKDKIPAQILGHFPIDPLDVKYDIRKFRWVHIFSSEPWRGELQIDSHQGWSKSIKLNVGLPFHSEVKRLVIETKQIRLSQGELKTVDLDFYDSKIEVIVPGELSDGWDASLDDQTGYTLSGIEGAGVAEGRSQVKLIFTKTSTLQDSTLIIRQGHGFFKKKWTFKIAVLPTPLC